jgi:hypothetical protein
MCSLLYFKKGVRRGRLYGAKPRENRGWGPLFCIVGSWRGIGPSALSFLGSKEGYWGAFTQYNGYELQMKKIGELYLGVKLQFAYDLLFKHITKRPSRA